MGLTKGKFSLPPVSGGLPEQADDPGLPSRLERLLWEVRERFPNENNFAPTRSTDLLVTNKTPPIYLEEKACGLYIAMVYSWMEPITSS